MYCWPDFLQFDLLPQTKRENRAPGNAVRAAWSEAETLVVLTVTIVIIIIESIYRKKGPHSSVRVLQGATCFSGNSNNFLQFNPDPANSISNLGNTCYKYSSPSIVFLYRPQPKSRPKPLFAPRLSKTVTKSALLKICLFPLKTRRFPSFLNAMNDNHPKPLASPPFGIASRPTVVELLHAFANGPPRIRTRRRAANRHRNAISWHGIGTLDALRMSSKRRILLVPWLTPSDFFTFDELKRLLLLLNESYLNLFAVRTHSSWWGEPVSSWNGGRTTRMISRPSDGTFA